MFGVKFLISFKRSCGHYGQIDMDGRAHDPMEIQQLEAEENAKPCDSCAKGRPVK